MTRPTVPSSTQPIAGGGGIITTVWQRFFNALVGPPEAIANVPAKPSPHTYTASQGGILVVSGGTVNNIKLRRATVELDLGTIRVVPVASGDVVTITYSVTPTISFVPS